MLLTRRTVLVAALLVFAALPGRTPAQADDHNCWDEEIPDADGLGTTIRRVCPGDDDGGPGGGSGAGDGESDGGGGGPACDWSPSPFHESEIRDNGDGGSGSWWLYYYICDDGSSGQAWICENCSTDEEDEPDWLAMRDDLVDEVAGRVQPPLPGFETSAASPRAPEVMAAVHSQTWWWVRNWTPIVAEGTDGPLWIRVTATPRSLTVDPGDGSEAIECPDGGTTFDFSRDYYSQAGQSDCIHVYTRTSASEPEQTVTVTATVTWDVTWEAAGVAEAIGSGVISSPSRTETLDLPVGEIQSVVTR